LSRQNRHDIAPADLDRFAKLAEARLGIRAEAGDLRTALAERVAATGAASVSTYVERLDNHQVAKEWSALANHLTVPETYFFRNPGHWKAFAEYAIPRIAGQQGAQSPLLRIWSAGCSTGEEPYTISMVLAEMGLSKLVGAGSILATDLLEESLATAKKACYRHNSFRGVLKVRIDRCFQRNGDLLAVRDDIRKAVTFRQLNLADVTAVTAFIAREGPFHVIFCRNVLIYFTPKVCSLLLDQLADALAPDGTLFLGHSEFPHMWTNTLESVPVGNTFVWRRRLGASGPERVEEWSEAAEVSPAPIPLVPVCPSVPCEPTESTAPTPMATGAPQVAELSAAPADMPVSVELPKDGANGMWLAVAQVIEQTQHGRDTEALAAARELVDRNELSPEAHYVLGVTLEMGGEASSALEAYRKAAFLDSGFAHAHWRLAQVLGARKQTNRAIAEARWAVRTAAGESDERVSHLSDVGRQALTRMMEQTLEWLLEQKQPKTACAAS